MFSCMDYIELEHLVEKQLKPSRFAHSKSCALTMDSLAKRFSLIGPDDPSALCIGIWHDMARSWSDEALLEYCEAHSLVMVPEERKHPMLLHGLVASALMEDAPTAWKAAVRWHTLGDVSMGALGLALYIADYLEPLRIHVSDQRRDEILACTSLEDMTLLILEDQKEYFERQGIVTAACTARLEGFLREGGCCAV